MRQQNPTHFWVFVLTFVDDSLKIENRILKNKSHSPSTNSKFDYYKYNFQTLIYKSHDKNLKMCRGTVEPWDNVQVRMFFQIFSTF